MDNLPPEILVTIAKYLTSKSCCYLTMTSKQYSWLLHDFTLWKHYAKRDLNCPDIVFETVKKNLPGYQVYTVLSRCQANVDIEGTRFMQKCNEKIVSGCSFCREHCDNNDIPVCRCCEVRVCDDAGDMICAICQQTQSYRNGCKNCRFGKRARCGAKRKEGSDFCQSCINNYGLEERRGIDVVTCPLVAGHYMIVTDDLRNIVITQTIGGQLIALGKIPSTLTNETISSVNQLILLTPEETALTVETGITFPPSL